MLCFLSKLFRSILGRVAVYCGKILPMMKKGSPFSVLIVVLLSSTFLWPQTVYERSSKTDIPLMSGAIGGISLGFYLSKNIKPLTSGELSRLDRKDVPSFDRWACRNFSRKADKISDIFLGICAVSPLLMYASPNLENEDRWTYALMFLETGILTYSITEITKCLVGRIRPFAYNPDVTFQEKSSSANTRKSFFSGHTSISFASIVLLAQTYSAFYPESRWKPVVWGAGLSAATLVGVLRILSGKHFPSDVLVGALVGSVIGFIIPRLHKAEPNSSHDSLGPFQVSFRISF